MKTVVQTLDEVPEHHREHYVPMEGSGFQLDVDIENHPEIRGLRSAKMRVESDCADLNAQIDKIVDRVLTREYKDNADFMNRLRQTVRDRLIEPEPGTVEKQGGGDARDSA
jgi:hypothetical protein